MKKWLSGVLFFMVMIAFPVFAGEEEIGLEWNANVEPNIGGYGAYIGDTAEGPYTKFADILHPTIEVWYTFQAPDGVITRKYFVVDAHNDDEDPLRSGFSNEVFWDYDWAPIEVAIELKATVLNDVITFTWKQGDIARIKE